MTTPTAPAPIIEPMEGWSPNCKYGFQMIDDSPWGRMVRLEDVAIWLAQKMPRDDVIYALFSELICDDGEEAAWLYVLNARTHPKNLIRVNSPTQETAGLWQFLESVDQQSSAEDVARAIAEEWKRVWPGVADPNTDADWRIERVIAQNKQRGAAAKALSDGEVPAWVSVDFDGEDKLLSMERLRKLAIPIPKAYALWGWGAAVEGHVVTEARSIAAAEVTDIDSLVRYRQQFRNLPLQQRPDWNSTLVHIARLAVKAHGRGGLAKFGPLLCMTGEGLRQLFDRYPPPKASPFPVPVAKQA